MTDEENRQAWSEAVAQLAATLEARTSGHAPDVATLADPQAGATVLADLALALMSRLAKDEDSLTRWILDLDSSPTLADALAKHL